MAARETKSVRQERPGPSNREDVAHNSRWNGEFTRETRRQIGQCTTIKEILPSDSRREREK